MYIYIYIYIHVTIDYMISYIMMLLVSSRVVLKCASCAAHPPAPGGAGRVSRTAPSTGC